MSEKLQIKLQENKERRIREKYIKEIPEKYLTLFSECKFCYTQEIMKNIKTSFMPKFDNGILLTKDNFNRYFYLDYDRPEHVIECLTRIKYNFGNYYIKIQEGPFFELNDSQINGLDSTIELFKWNYKLDYLLIDTSYNSGIYLDSYSGFIEKSRITNYSEISYEIILWEL